MDHVTFDVEIRLNINAENPCGSRLGWHDTDRMGVAVACLWEHGTQRMRVYGEREVEALQQRLLAADRISGFNIWRFDFPVVFGLHRSQWVLHTDLSSHSDVLVAEKMEMDADPIQQLMRRLRSRTDDVLERIGQALGHSPDAIHRGWSLDAVAKATLGVGKVANGAEAPRMYQAGRWSELVNYCADDTAIERDLTEFVDRYGYVSNGERRLELPRWRPQA